MSKWVSTRDSLPEEGREVSTYFWFTGYDTMIFEKEPMDPEIYGEKYKDLYSNVFYSKRGFLTDDWLLWSYDLSLSKEKAPIPKYYLESDFWKSDNPRFKDQKPSGNPKIEEEEILV